MSQHTAAIPCSTCGSTDDVRDGTGHWLCDTCESKPAEVVFSFKVTGWTAEDIQALIGEVLAQGNDSDEHPDVSGIVSLVDHNDNVTGAGLAV